MEFVLNGAKSSFFVIFRKKQKWPFCVLLSFLGPLVTFNDSYLKKLEIMEIIWILQKKWVWVDFGYFGPLFDLQTHTAPGDPEKRGFSFAAQNMVQSA